MVRRRRRRGEAPTLPYPTLLRPTPTLARLTASDPQVSCRAARTTTTMPTGASERTAPRARARGCDRRAWELLKASLSARRRERRQGRRLQAAVRAPLEAHPARPYALLLPPSAPRASLVAHPPSLWTPTLFAHRRRSRWLLAPKPVPGLLPPGTRGTGQDDDALTSVAFPSNRAHASSTCTIPMPPHAAHPDVDARAEAY